MKSGTKQEKENIKRNENHFAILLLNPRIYFGNKSAICCEFFLLTCKEKKIKNLWQIKLLSQSLPWLKKQTRNGCLLSMPPVKEIMKSWLFMKKIKKRKKHFCKMSYQAFAIFFQGTFIQCLSDPSIRIDLYSQ
jgi:hypothetical protein